MKTILPIIFLSFGNLLSAQQDSCFFIDKVTQPAGEIKCLVVTTGEKNELEKLPLNNYYNLTELHINFTNLDKIPLSITGINKLKRLDVSFNNVFSVDSGICKLTYLRDLYLDMNRVMYLPDCIGNVDSLETLLISNNNLKKLPASLALCAQLKVLDISQNKNMDVNQAWSVISKMENLQELYMDGLPVTTFPLQENKLKKLTCIELSFDKKLIQDSVYLALFKCDHLRILRIKNSKMKKMGKKVSLMNQLTTLDLSKNLLKEFPMETITLTNLTELDLSDNKIKKIPDEIGSLKKLEILSIVGNPISKEELQKLTRLLPNCKIISQKKVTLSSIHGIR